jgi:hypothetical protein
MLWPYHFLVVSPGKIFFQPDVKADKKIPATHFLDLELGDAGATIAPSDRHGSETETADDSFQR